MNNNLLKEDLKMSETKDLLKDEWMIEKEKLSTMDYKTHGEMYKIQTDRVMNLEKLMTDIDKVEIETEEKAISKDIDERLKIHEIETNAKDQKRRNWIDTAKVVVPVAGAFIMGLISMKWEKTDTLTSSAGRSSLRDILKFKI